LTNSITSTGLKSAQMGCNGSTPREVPDVAMVEQQTQELAAAQSDLEKVRGQLAEAQERAGVQTGGAGRVEGLEREVAQLRQQLQKAEGDVAEARRALEQSTKELAEARRESDELRAKLASKKRKSKKVVASSVVVTEAKPAAVAAPAPAVAPAKEKSFPALAAAAAPGDASVEKLRQELDAERKLTAELRAEAMRKTKESLAAAAAGGGAGGKNASGSVVVVAATEQQRMAEAMLRSDLSQARETAQEERARRTAAEEEARKAAEARSAALAQLSGKDAVIADLTVRLHAAQGAASHVESLAGLDSKLSELDSRHDKLDNDMEMMTENFRLAGLLAEREEQIAALKAQLAAK
jgi:chromosome segregation ATPase